MPNERPAIVAKAKLEHEEALIAAAIAEERKAVQEADHDRADMASWRSTIDTLRTDSSSFDKEFNEKAYDKASTAHSKRSGLSSLFRSCMGIRK